MTYRRTRRLRLKEIDLLQRLAEHVVFAVEQTFRMSGRRKKEIAVQVTRQLLSELGITTHNQTLEIAIEAAVRLMNLLEAIAS